MAQSFEAAEQRLFTACGLNVASRHVELADPPVRVRVLESGDGPPLVLVHASGMSASTWAPLMPHLDGHRLIAFDLPGFGLSDAYDYSGRSLREHAVAQLTSVFDAVGLDDAAIVGTSLGAMWALCFALAAPIASPRSRAWASPPSPSRACAVTRSSRPSRRPESASSSRAPGPPASR